VSNLISFSTLFRAVIGAVAALLLIFISLFLGPYLLYVLRSPSLQAECNKARPGTKAEDVLTSLNQSTPPYDEGHSANMIFFSRNGATCEVHLNGQGVVVKTVTQKREAIVE
jgi:hypothetical protein